MNFYTSLHCTSRAHCNTCRDLKDGAKFREQLKEISSDLSTVDFECPIGKKWGERIEIRTNPDVYSAHAVVGNRNNRPLYLSNSWSFINWLLQHSEKTKTTIKLTKHPLFEEIIPLLDSTGTIELVDEIGSKTNDCRDIENTPTKIQWKPGPYKRLCYQVNSSFVINPPRWDLLDFFEKFKDYQIIKIGNHISLKECVELLASSDAFFGVSSGMSHLAQSVGTPNFIMTYNVDIRKQHGWNKYVLCKDLAECEILLRKWLDGDVYEPTMHLPDPFAPITVIGCGCQIWDQIKDLGGTIVDLLKFVMEPRSNDVDYLKRQEICQKCQAVDSKGERLFRNLNEKYFTCGEFRSDNILRDSHKDGCGCILNMKWLGRNQTCVRSYWDEGDD
jgi:hypothetical protein